MSAARVLSILVFGLTALFAGRAPAEASRECENPNYAPTVGRCAHLKTSDLYYRDTGAPPKIARLITVRTLLITGGGDMLTPRGAMKLWGSHIKNAQWVMLDTGHAPQIEDPRVFNESVLRFLKGGPATAGGCGR